MKYSGEELRMLTTADGGKFKFNDLHTPMNFTRKLALGHYENFPVASALLPMDKRQHIYNIYAFARIADDIADETSIPTSDEKIELLDKYSELLNNCLSVNNENPIFFALGFTIKKFAIPLEPFQKLISAFKQDVVFRQPQTLNDVYDYCSRSANPVGELLLRIFDQYNPTTAKYSDSICTGLQLANFWQDLSRDLPNGRCYIPEEILKKYNITNSDLLNRKKSRNFTKCLEELIQIVVELFDDGKNLIKLLEPYRLRLEINATLNGGRKILEKVSKLQGDILGIRPKLSKLDFANIAIRSILT